jgi:DNA-binding beta-propeller fold protein YncE
MVTAYNQGIFFRKLRNILQAAIPSVLLLGAIATPADAFSLRPIGTYSTGIFDEGAAEIAAYDPGTQRLFVTNADSNNLDILDISDPTTPTLFGNIDLSGFGGGVNSVAFGNNMFAVAVEAEVAQDPGSVLFFDVTGNLMNSVTVGPLPDMVTFTPDGKKLLVANEGEPSDDYTNDPEGSVSIIDVLSGNVTTAGFNNVPLVGDVRIFGPGASVAQDLEPEYITVSADSKKAWVSLQENNALGILDIESGEVEKVVGLGYKDHSEDDNPLDASDKDDEINIRNWPVLGMYQPDAIASYAVGDRTYVVTANEGDARDYDAFSEEERIEDLTLDPDAFPNAAELQQEENLGRLTVTNTRGDTDGDGDFDELYAFGGRSFSIFDEEGNLVFDSGDDFEQITADRFPNFFNSDNDENTFDTRSDAKGPEPEGITIGTIFGRTYAFIGLERIGGIMTYDITDPNNPMFLDYVNNRDFSGDAEAGTAGDLGPEGLLFVSADESPNQQPLLVVTNEVSGSTTLYSIDAPEPSTSVPEPAAGFGLLAFGSLGWLRLKRKR